MEEETRPSENPRTILCELKSVDVLTSDPTGGLIPDPSLPIAVATVDVDDSGTICAGGGDDGRGVVSSHDLRCCGGRVCDSCGGKGESGSSSFFSLIEFTIFSRSIGVICFSLPRLRLSVESCRCIEGLTDVRSDLEVLEVREASSFDDSESMLDESSGTTESFDNFRVKDQRGEKTAWWSGAQQKVSRLHNLQLMFS